MSCTSGWKDDRAVGWLEPSCQKRMIEGSKGIFRAATEIDAANPPEDQVATFVRRQSARPFSDN